MRALISSRRALTVAAICLAAVPVLTACATRPSGPRGPACDAIEAAMAIESPTDRLDALNRIAVRDDLSQNDQIYLVNAICQGGFSNDQATALVTLIANPVSTEQTHRHIDKTIRHRHMLGPAKRRVVEALRDYLHPQADAIRSPTE